MTTASMIERLAWNPSEIAPEFSFGIFEMARKQILFQIASLEHRAELHDHILMNATDTKIVVVRFNDCINARDIEGL